MVRGGGGLVVQDRWGGGSREEGVRKRGEEFIHGILGNKVVSGHYGVSRSGAGSKCRER